MNVSNTSQQYPCSFPLFFPSKWAQATWNVSCLCCACCAAVDFISASTNIAYLPQSHNHHHSPAHHLPSQHIVSHSTFHFLLPAPSHTQSSNYWWLEQPRRLRPRLRSLQRHAESDDAVDADPSGRALEPPAAASVPRDRVRGVSVQLGRVRMDEPPLDHGAVEALTRGNHPGVGLRKSHREQALALELQRRRRVGSTSKDRLPM